VGAAASVGLLVDGMSAEACPHTQVHYCAVCGPVMQDVYEFYSVTFHQQVPHPEHMKFDEEENPQ
jgi:hypothetical protein